MMKPGVLAVSAAPQIVSVVGTCQGETGISWTEADLEGHQSNGLPENHAVEVARG